MTNYMVISASMTSGLEYPKNVPWLGGYMQQALTWKHSNPQVKCHT